MRTTIPVDDDLLDRARTAAERLQIPFRRVINQALRAGLETLEATAESRPYRTVSRALGLRKGCNLDNIQELLSQVEGEVYR